MSATFGETWMATTCKGCAISVICYLFYPSRSDALFSNFFEDLLCMLPWPLLSPPPTALQYLTKPTFSFMDHVMFWYRGANGQNRARRHAEESSASGETSRQLLRRDHQNAAPRGKVCCLRLPCVNCRPVLTAKECARSVATRCGLENLDDHWAVEYVKVLRMAGTIIDYICHDDVGGMYTRYNDTQFTSEISLHLTHLTIVTSPDFIIPCRR